MTDHFKNKYRYYATEYKHYLSKKADKQKRHINKILEPFVYEKGVCNIITDYLPYKRDTMEYNFEKIRSWDKHTTLAYNTLPQYKDINNILLLYLRKEKYLNKTRLDHFISGLDFLFNMIYMDEPSIHILYTLLFQLQKHSSFKVLSNCKTIQDFQIFLNLTDTYGYDIFRSCSYFINKRMTEDNSIRNTKLRQISLNHNIYEMPKEYETYNECGCLEGCECDCLSCSCKCGCEWYVFNTTNLC